MDTNGIDSDLRSSIIKRICVLIHKRSTLPDPPWPTRQTKGSHARPEKTPECPGCHPEGQASSRCHEWHSGGRTDSISERWQIESGFIHNVVSMQACGD